MKIVSRKPFQDETIIDMQFELHLRSLCREMIRGNTNLLPEFRELVQYAPDQMKTRIDNYVAKLEQHA